LEEDFTRAGAIAGEESAEVLVQTNYSPGEDVGLENCFVVQVFRMLEESILSR
jgi:hypothetical protein